MIDSELDELERGIRALLTEFDLTWVLSDIEEGIKAKGRIEVVVPPRRRKADAELPLDINVRHYAVPTPGYKGPTMVGDVPVDSEDRVDLILDALHRLLVELPSIHEDAVNRLADTVDHDSMADDIAFQPDADDAAPEVLGIEAVKAFSGRRQKAAEFLSRLTDEVMGR